MPREGFEKGTRRRVLAIGGVVLAIVLAAGLVFYLPPDLRHLLIGRTVEHCPDSEFSCPSQSPGLLLFLVPVPIILDHLFGGEPDAE